MFESAIFKLHELVRWFHEDFSFRHKDLPLVAIPILAGSLVLPLLAWWLKRRQFISTGTQRIVEIAWLSLLTLVTSVGWGIWARDYGERSGAFVHGIAVGIAMVVLSVSGIGQWRLKKCLAVKSLLVALFRVVAHLCLFYACVVTVAIVGLFFVIPRDAPLAALFLPEWIGRLFLVLALTLYLMIAAWAVPVILRRWKNRPCMKTTTDHAPRT